MCKYCNVYAEKFPKYNFCPMCSAKIKKYSFFPTYKTYISSCFINNTRDANSREFVHKE